MQTDTIKRLCESYRELEAGERNQARKKKWAGVQRTSRDLWRGTPKADGSCRSGDVPVIAGFSNLFWHDYFGFSMHEYMLNPGVYLEHHLKIAIERFNLIDDDYFLDKQIPLRMASVFEAGMFGMKAIYERDAEPHLDYTPAIRDYEDLDNIPPVDFTTTGRMPDAIHLYESLLETVDDDFYVHFPEWIRAPFGVALYLRGFDNLLMDFYDEPDFVTKLLTRITDEQIAWIRRRERFTGRKQGKINLYNDDVSFPIVSPDMYRDFILPQEQRLAKEFGGVFYWHSCGCLDPLYPLITEVGDIDIIHCSAWSNPADAVKAFPNTPIEICTNTERDVIANSDEELYNYLYKICSTLNQGGAAGYALNMEGIDTMDSTFASIDLAKKFLYAARKAAEAAGKKN